MMTNLKLNQRTIPPVPDSNQVWYLLLHVCDPSQVELSSSGKPAQCITQAKQACKKVGLSLEVFTMSTGSKHSADKRYFFRFPRYRRDDRLATYYGEMILNIAWVTCGPLGTPHDTAAILRVPRELIERGLPLFLDDLITLEYSRQWSDRVLYFPNETIGSHTEFIEEKFLQVWKRLPSVSSNDFLFRAVRFLKASMENFYVYPDKIAEIVDSPETTAQSPSEQTALESAVQHAFMALEAIIGDPPKDDKKLSHILRKFGLDPLEEFGYSNKKPLIQIIREFNHMRDKISAHGSTKERRITVSETLEFQSCASYVVNFVLDTTNER
jgi:hypothetical protein